MFQESGDFSRVCGLMVHTPDLSKAKALIVDGEGNVCSGRAVIDENEMQGLILTYARYTACGCYGRVRLYTLLKN